MKKIKLLGFALLSFTLFTQCGPSLKVSNDYDRSADFTQYKTFNLYKLEGKGNISELNYDRINKAIASEMKAKGFIETDTNPDLLVNAVTILKDQQSVSSNTNVYGYGGMYRPYGMWGGGMGMATANTTYNTYNYKAGTFTIDIVDAKTKKMVWQGTGSADIDSAPKDPDATVQAGVTKILAGFPPGMEKK